MNDGINASSWQQAWCISDDIFSWHIGISDDSISFVYYTHQEQSWFNRTTWFTQGTQLTNKTLFLCRNMLLTTGLQTNLQNTDHLYVGACLSFNLFIESFFSSFQNFCLTGGVLTCCFELFLSSCAFFFLLKMNSLKVLATCQCCIHKD